MGNEAATVCDNDDLKSFYRRVAPPPTHVVEGTTAASEEDDRTSTSSLEGPTQRRVVEWFEPTAFTIGPHQAQFQHGGPPAALMLLCTERLGATVGLSVVSHTTLQLFRPVPVDALMRVATTTVRKGSRVGHFRSSLFSYAPPPRRGGQEQGDRTGAGAEPSLNEPELELVAQLTAVLQRRSPVSNLPPPPPLTRDWLAPPPFGGEWLDMDFYRSAKRTYFDAVKARVSKGGPGTGYTTFWFHFDASTVEGEPQSTAQKFLIMADSGGGGSFYVDTRRFQFSNPDFSVSFLQHPQLEAGDWIGMTAQSGLDGETGAGMVFTKLFTRGHTVGIATQSLTVRHRHKPLRRAKL